MTIAKRIETLEKELIKLKEQIKADVLKEYRELPNRTSYVVTGSDEVAPCLIFSENLIEGYYRYHTKEYAEMAKEMKEFNDKLLAFKWCYDRDYVPDWEDTSICKHCVIYNNCDGQYERHTWYGEKYPTVYFSTREIAQKCCDWLNGTVGDK